MSVDNSQIALIVPPVDAGVPDGDDAGLVGREEGVRRDHRPADRADRGNALKSENRDKLNSVKYNECSSGCDIFPVL